MIKSKILFSLFVCISLISQAQIAAVIPSKIKLADSRDKVHRCSFANGNILQIDKSFWNLKASKNNLNFYLFDSKGKQLKEALFTMETAPFDGGLVDDIYFYNNKVLFTTYRRDKDNGHRFYSVDDQLNIKMLIDYNSDCSFGTNSGEFMISPDGNTLAFGGAQFDKELKFLGNCSALTQAEWDVIEGVRIQQNYIDNQGNVFFSCIFTPKEGKVNRFKGTREVGWIVGKRDKKTNELLAYDIVPHYKGTTPQDKSVFVGNDGKHVYALIQGHTLVVLNESNFELEKVIDIDLSVLPRSSEGKNFDKTKAYQIKFIPGHGFLLTMEEYKVISGSGYMETTKSGLTNLILVDLNGKIADITTLHSGVAEGNSSYDQLSTMADIRDGQLEFYCIKTQSNMDKLASGEYASAESLDKNSAKESKVFQVKKNLSTGKMTYKEIAGVPLSGYSSYSGYFDEIYGVLKGWDNGKIDHVFFKR